MEKKKPSAKQLFDAKQQWKTQVAMWRNKTCESAGRVAAAVEHAKDCTVETQKIIESMSVDEYDDSDQRAVLDHATTSLALAKECGSSARLASDSEPCRC